MTIDDAIKWIEEHHSIDLKCKDDEAHRIAIDIMRKYQKIKQIAFPLQFCSTDKLNHEAIMKICEVLEDGKNE